MLWVLDIKAELKFRIIIICIKGKKGTPYYLILINMLLANIM
ncbi:hypothetical protein HpCHN10_15430 [Helicobacter pylori]